MIHYCFGESWWIMTHSPRFQPAATPNVLAPGIAAGAMAVWPIVAHGMPGLCCGLTASRQETDGFGALFGQELRRDLHVLRVLRPLWPKWERHENIKDRAWMWFDGCCACENLWMSVKVSMIHLNISRIIFFLVNRTLSNNFPFCTEARGNAQSTSATAEDMRPWHSAHLAGPWWVSGWYVARYRLGWLSTKIR